MSTERGSRKAAQELTDFRRFVHASGLMVCPGSERSGDPNLGEPDVVCVLDNQTIGFELTAACAPEFAAASTKAHRTNPGASAAFGENASAQTLRKRLSKTYTVTPVHLLIHRGLTALTDEMIIDTLVPELAHGLGPLT